MDLYSVAQDAEKLESIAYMAEDAMQVKRHSSAFISRLASVCEDPRVKERWGASIELAEDGLTAEINSPFGYASAHLSFFVGDSNSIEGRWDVRKTVLDTTGKVASEWVTSFRVLKSGLVFVGADQKIGIPSVNRIPRDDEDRTAYQVATALLYLIGRFRG